MINIVWNSGSSMRVTGCERQATKAFASSLVVLLSSYLMGGHSRERSDMGKNRMWLEMIGTRSFSFQLWLTKCITRRRHISHGGELEQAGPATFHLHTVWGNLKSAMRVSATRSSRTGLHRLIRRHSARERFMHRHLEVLWEIASSLWLSLAVRPAFVSNG